MANSVYDFEATDIQGRSTPLSQYQGKVLLINDVRLPEV